MWNDRLGSKESVDKTARAHRASIVFSCVAMSLLISCAPAVPARAFLYKGEKPEEGLGAYGYVVFTRRPAEGHRTRYLAVCDAFLRHLESQEAYTELPDSSLMVTYWPLAAERWDAETGNCETLVNQYDYAFAAVLASTMGKLAARGPVLTAGLTAYDGEEEWATQSLLIVDLSSFEPVDMDVAFASWKQRITQDPEVWRNGFTREKVRVALRNLLNRYGEEIVEVLDQVL